MTQLNATQQKFVDDFAADPDIQQIVKDIEAKPATTRNHYGDYGAALSKLSGGPQGCRTAPWIGFREGRSEQSRRQRRT